MSDVDTHDWIGPLKQIAEALDKQGLDNMAGILNSTAKYINLCHQQQRVDAELIRMYQTRLGRSANHGDGSTPEKGT